MANGGIYWNYKFYDPNQNPNTVNSSAVNSTFHLEVKYNSVDGTFIMYWQDGSAPDYHNTTMTSPAFLDWSDYFNKYTVDPSLTTALTHPRYVTVASSLVAVENGVSVTYNYNLLTYTNSTTRRVYAIIPMSPSTRGAVMRARDYDDLFVNNTLTRYFYNGTISAFTLDVNQVETFVNNIVPPTYLFEENNYELYTVADNNNIAFTAKAGAQQVTGWNWVQYLNATERLVTRPNAVSDSRYYNATSINYEEHIYSGLNYYRVVFNNGTIALYYYCSGTVAAAGPPITHCQSLTNVARVAFGANDFLTPRPYGTLGGLTASAGSLITPITFGSMQNQFYKFEKLPFALAKEYVQSNNSDNSFYRVY